MTFAYHSQPLRRCSLENMLASQPSTNSNWIGPADVTPSPLTSTLKGFGSLASSAPTENSPEVFPAVIVNGFGAISTASFSLVIVRTVSSSRASESVAVTIAAKTVGMIVGSKDVSVTVTPSGGGGVGPPCSYASWLTFNQDLRESDGSAGALSSGRHFGITSLRPALR